MFNVDDSNKAIFQCYEVFEELNTIYGHAFKNVLKRKQSFINGARLTPTINISINEAIRVGINVWSSISISNSNALIAKHVQFMSKAKMLSTQSFNIASMARQL